MCHKTKGGENRKRYTSDLSDGQWAKIKPLLPLKRGGVGRPVSINLREALNAMLYLLKTGCQWRNLPAHFPHHQSVYYHYRKWCRDGTWEQINRALLYETRRAAGRLPYPSAGVLDSQSAKTSNVGGVRGFDAGKKVKGRKRQILVDSLGHLWQVWVHPADQGDVVGAKRLLSALPAMVKLRLFKVWADYAYRGPFTNWCRRTFRCDVEIVRPPKFQTTFAPLPRRWVVERTFAWLSNYRRLTRDFERFPRHSEGFIYLASIHRSLCRLAA